MNFSISDFSWTYFLISLIITLLPFFWLIKRPVREKLYVIPYIVFFFIYSGAGIAWDNCNKAYIPYYFIWMSFFSLAVCLAMGRRRCQSVEGVQGTLSFWVIQYADIFIYSYIILQLLSLGISGKMYNLLSPPSPDLLGVMEQVEEGHGEGGIIYYLKHILFVFYFVSLYKYRNSPLKLFIAIFFPFYVSYAGSGYLARSTVMGYLIIFIIAVYYYNPQLRKRIRLLVGIGLPFVLVGLSFYTFIRIGHDIDITPGEAIKLLAYQETSYPTQFDLIQKLHFDTDLLKDYWEWLITLPLPGFLKDSSKDYFFNAIFTENIYGTMRGQMGFSVALPSIVGEGIFIFGRDYFFLHAVLLGFFVGTTYRIVKRKEEFFFFLYAGVFMAFHSARAGTVATYSMYLKDFLMYEIILLFVATIKKPGQRKHSLEHVTQ